jgi:hypothetical protein
MIKPRHRLGNGCNCGYIQGQRPLQQNDRQPKRSRSNDFTVSRCTAAVLRDDDVDLMLAQQVAFPIFAEGSAFKNIGRMRYSEWRIHGIDAANQVTVLERGGKGRDLLTADGEKHMARLSSQGACRLVGIRHFSPAIAGDGAPRRPTQGKEGRAGLHGGTQRVSRHRRCIRMRGIDQCVDLVVAQILHEPGGSAETARSYRHGLRQRRRGATGERQGNRAIVTDRKPFAKQSCLRRAAQNEDVVSHVAR